MSEQPTPTQQPLVSVGIPTYNRPEGLRRTLECLTNQTHTNLEIIVSDNCSPDPAVAEVVQSFVAKDTRIRYFRQSENTGPLRNGQFVLERASGEYFMWAADDDYVGQNYVSALVNILQQNEHSNLAAAKIVNVHSDGTSIETAPVDETINRLLGTRRIRALIERHYSAWIYGVFRTASLRRSFWILKSSTWIACTDRLLLYDYIFNGALVVTNQTTFYSGCRPPHENPGYRPKKRISYCLWAFSLSGRALRLLYHARISLGAKIALLPFFLGHLCRKYWVQLLSLR